MERIEWDEDDGRFSAMSITHVLLSTLLTSISIRVLATSKPQHSAFSLDLHAVFFTTTCIGRLSPLDHFYGLPTLCCPNNFPSLQHMVWFFSCSTE